MMNTDPEFREKLTKKIWDDYFYRVKRSIKRLGRKQRSEIEMELKSLLYESFLEKEAENETEKLVEAIDKLGKPEEYMKSVVSEKILNGVGKSINLKNLILGIIYSPSSAIKVSMMLFVLVSGCVCSFTLTLLAVLRVFNENAGIFRSPHGSYLLGIPAESDTYIYDVLGIWTIPVLLISAAVIYVSIGFLIKKLIR